MGVELDDGALAHAPAQHEPGADLPGEAVVGHRDRVAVVRARHVERALVDEAPERHGIAGVALAQL